VWVSGAARTKTGGFISDSTVSSGNGGGAYVAGTVDAPATAVFSDVDFDANTADLGGGLYVGDTATVTSEACTFTGNVPSSGHAAGPGVDDDWDGVVSFVCTDTGCEYRLSAPRLGVGRRALRPAEPSPPSPSPAGH